MLSDRKAIFLKAKFHAFSRVYRFTISMVWFGVEEPILALTLWMRLSSFTISSLYLFIVGLTVVSFALLPAYQFISFYLSKMISGSYSKSNFLPSFKFLIREILAFAAVSMSLSRLFSSLSNMLLDWRPGLCCLSFEYFFYSYWRMVATSSNCFGWRSVREYIALVRWRVRSVVSMFSLWELLKATGFFLYVYDEYLGLSVLISWSNIFLGFFVAVNYLFEVLPLLRFASFQFSLPKVM